MRKPYEYLLSKISENAKKCQEFQNNSKPMFVIESAYLETMHYVVINKCDNQPYELHTKVIGMHGTTVCSIPVEEFTEHPRKISYDEFLQLAKRIHPGLEKLYAGINAKNWIKYADAFSKYKT